MVDPIIIGLATQGGYAVLSFAVGYFFNNRSNCRLRFDRFLMR